MKIRYLHFDMVGGKFEACQAIGENGQSVERERQADRQASNDHSQRSLSFFSLFIFCDGESGNI